MAYGDEKRPSGIVDTRIKPEGPQFPPRPPGFTYSKEIEKEIKKRLPAAPYVPTRADEALDESPEARELVFAPPRSKAEALIPPKPMDTALVVGKSLANISRLRQDLYIDDRPPVSMEELFRDVYKPVHILSESDRSDLERELAVEYKRFFSHPNIREATYRALRSVNPKMRTGRTEWENAFDITLTDEDLKERTLTKIFLEFPITQRYVYSFSSLYRFLRDQRPDLFTGVQAMEPEQKSGPLPPYRF